MSKFSPALSLDCCITPTAQSTGLSYPPAHVVRQLLPGRGAPARRRRPALVIAGGVNELPEMLTPWLSLLLLRRDAYRKDDRFVGWNVFTLCQLTTTETISGFNQSTENYICNYFDYNFISNNANISWFQLLKCEDFCFLVLIMYYNIGDWCLFVKKQTEYVWTVGWTKRAIWRRRLDL